MRNNDPNVFPCLKGGVHRWIAVLRYFRGNGKVGLFVNAMVVGDRVVSSLAIQGIEASLGSAGFRTIALPMEEFMKAGGGVRCLSLPLASRS